ncbi:MAG: winged helix-turn-helix domain-containing protein [Candidatus Omnitrophica bacterium]|nr:winged helix-turn-helix domain-containing protein [Candidatus Omnitrophota bacterium]
MDQHGEVTLSELIRGIDKPRDNVLMSLGWLAREGHVILQQVDADYRIALRKNA